MLRRHWAINTPHYHKSTQGKKRSHLRNVLRDLLCPVCLLFSCLNFIALVFSVGTSIPLDIMITKILFKRKCCFWRFLRKSIQPLWLPASDFVFTLAGKKKKKKSSVSLLQAAFGLCWGPLGCVGMQRKGSCCAVLCWASWGCVWLSLCTGFCFHAALLPTLGYTWFKK